MYALRRSAARFLTSRPTSLISPVCSYTSLSAPSSRIAQRSPAFQLQRRWATTEAVEKPPVSAVEPTNAEELENASQTGAEPAADTQGNVTALGDSAADDTPIAETANATEATDEALPAAETGEKIMAESAGAAPQSNVDHAGMFDKKATLYVGNLFFDVTETDIVKEFARFGTVSRCKIVRDSRGLSKGFGYVDFSTQEAADAALERLNMSLFEGRRITVQYAARNSSVLDQQRVENKPTNPPSKTLFIGNMSFEMTDRDLTALFRGVRNVIDVRVAIDRRTGQPRGFAHADFIDVKSAMEAMKLLSEKEIYGRKLRVDYSYSSANRAPRNDQPPQN